MANWRARALGLFVLLQLVYLPLANFIQFVPRPMPEATGEFDMHMQREGTTTSIVPIQNAINAVSDVIDRYGELTGQAQAWSLFAPDFPKQSVFPVLEVYQAEGFVTTQTTYGSKLRPKDLNHYFRWPSPLSRFASYDYLHAVIYANFTPESYAEHPREWRQAVFDRVRQQQKSIMASFQLTAKFQREVAPGSPPPTSLVLSIEIIPSPPPGSNERPASRVVPLARWQPGVADDPAWLPIEAWDLETRQFVRLPREPEPRP